MTVLKQEKQKFYCVAGDTKPSTFNGVAVQNGIELVETDTGNEFLRIGGAWVQKIRPLIPITAFLSSLTTAGVFWLGFGDIAANGGEGDAQGQVFPQAIVVKRFDWYIKTNAHTASINARLRDDGADISNTTITVTTGATGLQTTGTITQAVGAGSKIAIQIDTTGAGTQALLGYFTMWFYPVIT